MREKPKDYMVTKFQSYNRRKEAFRCLQSFSGFCLRISFKQSMSKRKQSKLTDHTGQLDEWFGEEGLTLAAVRERLAQASCSVSLARLSEWRVNRDWERRRAQLLN